MLDLWSNLPEWSENLVFSLNSSRVPRDFISEHHHSCDCSSQWGRKKPWASWIWWETQTLSLALHLITTGTSRHLTQKLLCSITNIPSSIAVINGGLPVTFLRLRAALKCFWTRRCLKLKVWFAREGTESYIWIGISIFRGKWRYLSAFLLLILLILFGGLYFSFLYFPSQCYNTVDWTLHLMSNWSEFSGLKESLWLSRDSCHISFTSKIEKHFICYGYYQKNLFSRISR